MNRRVWNAKVRSALTALMVGLVALLGAGHASAAKFNGTFHVTNSTPLTVDVFGAIVIDVDNVTLDCANHQVHISSYTKALCNVVGAGKQKCAITAAGRSNVTITRCNIVGAFNQGVYVRDSNNVGISHITAAGVADSGFRIDYSSDVTFSGASAFVNNKGFNYLDSTNVFFDGLSEASGNVYGFMQNGGNAGYYFSVNAYENGIGFFGTNLGSAHGWGRTNFGSGATFGTLVAAHTNEYEGLLVTNSNDVDINWMNVTNNNQNAFFDAAGINLINVDNSSIQGTTARNNLVCDVKADSSSTGNAWGDFIANDFGQKCGSAR